MNQVKINQCFQDNSCGRMQKLENRIIVWFITYIHLVEKFIFICRLFHFLLSICCFFQVKNLRSQVSRLAIVCLGDFFVNLKKGIDPVSHLQLWCQRVEIINHSYAGCCAVMIFYWCHSSVWLYKFLGMQYK